MTEENSTSGDDGATDDPVVDETDRKRDDPTSEPDETTGRLSAPTGRKGAGIIAWLALLLAAIAIIASGLDFLRERSTAGDAAQASIQLNSQIRNLTASISATQEVMSSLEQNVSTLAEADTERDAAVGRIGRQLNDRLQQIESMPGRLAAVEASLSALQGISTGARDAWLLAEAEYYMQIANAQLQLARNPELAMLALTHADERVLRLADPRLMGVRQALSDELRALEAMEKPDTAGITLTLTSLAATVDSLPLKQETVAREKAAAAAIDPELTGMDRAMASIRNAVDGVVSISRADEEMEPLIAPEAEFFLRANLALQMQAARLALLRGEETVFHQSLDDVDKWLSDYYDLDSTPVLSARATISEVRGSLFAVAVPDISQSLRLLRQFNALSEAAAGTAPNDAAVPVPEEAQEPEE